MLPHSLLRVALPRMWAPEVIPNPAQETAPWFDERRRETMVRELVKRLRSVGCDVPTAVELQQRTAWEWREAERLAALKRK